MGARLFVLEVPEQLGQNQKNFEQKQVEAALTPYIGECKVFVLDGGWKLKELTRPEIELEDLPEPEEFQDFGEGEG